MQGHEGVQCMYVVNPWCTCATILSVLKILCVSVSPLHVSVCSLQGSNGLPMIHFEFMNFARDIFVLKL